MPLLVQITILLVALAIVLPILLWLLVMLGGVVIGLWMLRQEVNEERKSRGQ